ncbi:MAG: PIN domain-containing protein [Chloroflexi bacterium]|nr:MAG: PIN domain-containing protein [Chloroflexota bacterium]
MILLDTNVLVHALNVDSPRHPECLSVLQHAARGALPGVLVPQVLLECYSVITSPRRFAYPTEPEQAWGILRSLSEAIDVRTVPESLLDDLDGLLSQTTLRGRDVFDLALAAQMRSHGIRTICTYNVRDFDVIGIRAIEPAQALAVYA